MEATVAEQRREAGGENGEGGKGGEGGEGGLFEDIPLFTSLGCVAGALWQLWLIALSGEPLLVYGRSPAQVSRVVPSTVSLISPALTLAPALTLTLTLGEPRRAEHRVAHLAAALRGGLPAVRAITDRYLTA